MPKDCLKRAQTFWLSQRLRYLVPLKYTHLYGEIVTCECNEVGESFGALLSYATADMFWDVSMYPGSDRIVIPTASDVEAAHRLCVQVRAQFAGQSLVFKFSEPTTRDVFLVAFPMQYARTLVSYTAPHVVDGSASDPVWVYDEAVICTPEPDEFVRALYRSNGYTEEELQHSFSNGALSFALYERDRPVCACMVYQNFDDVWEIGGLHTLSIARRRGYGRRVVESALSVLAERALIPRYLVHTVNAPSVQLAESLGLVVGLNFEHYAMTSSVSK